MRPPRALARKQRLEAEQKLKAAEVPVVVATASLELGIDVGDVDLVVQVGSPRSIATFLQRVGRSGHSLGATPRGRLFALTRDQLVECAALVRAVRAGELDRIGIPARPLDVLSQQIVAECACEDWSEDALYQTFRRAWPYADLPRKAFDQVLEMLAEGITTERGRSRAHLHRDRVGGVVKGRRGARLAAITGGGAIPDRGDYTVVMEPEGLVVGTVEEDFAIESLAGDVFLLGNTAWKIRRIESRAAVIRVEDAAGAAPNVPFWFGEAPARTAELGQAVSALRREIDARRQAGESTAVIARAIGESASTTPEAAEQLVEYLATSAQMLGAMPTHDRIVIERFFDESGGMQLVVHAPFGGRINRAWGLALRKRFCVGFDFELQAAAVDDGICIALGPHHSFPLEAVFEFLHPDSVRDVLQQAILTGSPVWGTRWRWTVTRALAVLRFSGGKRTPFPLQRMRADDLLAAVFPDQAACQENIHGPIEPPDHPLVNETLEDVLTDWADVDGLRRVLTGIRSGAIETITVDTVEPSPLSHEILNANPYAFLDEAPLEERRSRAVALRRGLPSVQDGLGILDPEIAREVEATTRPVIRDPDELHDTLLTLGLLPPAMAAALSPGCAEWFASLVSDRRATLAGWPGGAAWVASERAEWVRSAIPGVSFDPEPPILSGLAQPSSAEHALKALVCGHVQISGPFTVADLAARLGLERSAVSQAIFALEGEGLVLRGHFTVTKTQCPDLQWCDRRLLSRIHRGTIAGLRKRIQPVTAADFLRFLLRWQHVMPRTRLSGIDGLGQILEQLQGFEIAAGAWEKDILPTRLRNYDPTWLDSLCLSGDLVWGRLSPREVGSGAAPGRAAPITFALREDLGWLLGQADPEIEASLSHPARDVLATLRERGALFTAELGPFAQRLPCEVEDGLWELVAAGLVTADGFAALRSLLVRGKAEKRRRRAARSDRRTRRLQPRLGRSGGRWSLLRPAPAAGPEADAEPTDTVDPIARQLLRRYGVVFRDLLAREQVRIPWRELLRHYRRLESRGEVRGGRFIAGFVGEQFALPEAVAALRAVRRTAPPKPEIVQVAATDPLNLVGILTPGPRVPAVLGGVVTYRNGVPTPAPGGDPDRDVARETPHGMAPSP